jgi:hypothetical protein
MRLLLAMLFLLISVTTSQAQTGINVKSCALVLENVPMDAVIRVTAFWTSDDLGDEAIEDEGYEFFVSAGAGIANPYLLIWRQPFATHGFNFIAKESRVVIEGRKYTGPGSTTHDEGLEKEGCDIKATINSLPPWVKDYSRNAFPYLVITASGLTAVSFVHPGVKIAAGGVGVTAVVAKVLADDPVDCSTPTIARPIDYFGPYPTIEEVDAMSIVGNKISRNGARTLGIAKAAVTNVNRYSCPDFTKEQQTALFNAAQNQGVRIGRHITRMKNQLNNLANLGTQAGLLVDVDNTFPSLTDTFFNFTLQFWFSSPGESVLADTLAQYLTSDELEYLREGAAGVPLIDFHNCNNGIEPCQLYPQFFLDGVRDAFPAMTTWANSLKLKEVGQ